VVRIAVVQRVALQLPPRRAARGDFKKAAISRAEGGQLQARVRRRRRRACISSIGRVVFGFTLDCLLWRYSNSAS